MMRHPADDIARGPGRMQEEPERMRHAELAQFRTERQEMINVLNPETPTSAAQAQQPPRAMKGIHFA